MRKLRHIFGIHFPFGLQRPLFSASLLITVFFLSLNQVAGKFDMLENWGFDQGGESGFRQGNFAGKDAGMVVTDMAWDAKNKRLAVAGALGSDWAVRLYDLSSGQPSEVSAWTGGGDLNSSIVTTIAWVAGGDRVVAGVEHFDFDKGNDVTLVVLDFEENNGEISSKKKLPDWNTVAECLTDPMDLNNIWVLGTKKANNDKDITVLLDFSLENLQSVSDEKILEGINRPVSLLIDDDDDERRFWVAGDNDQGRAIVEIVGSDHLKLRTQSYVSNFIKSGPNIYITGRETNREHFENIFLKCVSLEEGKIKERWEVSTEESEGDHTRDWGVALLPDGNGGVIMSGNFRKPWLLGQNEENENPKKPGFAFLASAGGKNDNFESFLAQYDKDGNLLWAQTSGMIGNDFAVDLVNLEPGFVLFLGNRNIDGGFGPYLGKIHLDENSDKNVEIVPPNTSSQEIFWDPPRSIRLGEPISFSMLSARFFGSGRFSYFLNDMPIEKGHFPFFTPGDLTLGSIKVPGNLTKEVKIEGKKGRLFLKIGYDKVTEQKVQFWAQLHGIAPGHEEFVDVEKLLSLVDFKSQDGKILDDGNLLLDDLPDGIFEVIGVFNGNEFFESDSRTLSLHVQDGILQEQDNSAMVSLKIHDLDGWQNSKSAPVGSVVGISAAQGFGKQKKFDRWVEFSEQDQVLRTAKVQDPFHIRTTLVAETDMTLFAKYNFSFVGTAVNGYLQGAQVFLDVNLNGIYDEGEPFGFTNQNGDFSIDMTVADEERIDLNQDGQIDSTEAMLVAVGGVDTASNLPLNISFRAPPNYVVISSVTTLVSELTESGLGLDESERLVRQALALPHAIELSSFEPLEVVLSESELSKKVVLRSTQLANFYNEAARYIQTNTGNAVNRKRAGEMIVESLGNRLINEKSNKNLVSLDLSKKDTLVSIMNEAVELARLESGSDLEENIAINGPSLSARTQLSLAQPALAKAGNNLMTDRLMENVAMANKALEDFSSDPTLEATDFKSLASALQSELNSLGDKAAATLLNKEVSALQSLQGDELKEGNEVLAVAEQVKSVAEIEEEHKSEISEVFNLTALRKLSQESKTNIFAPVLGVMRIVAPAELENNQVIGTFAAFDPEGGPVTYSFADGNPDLDEDGTPLLSIEENSGRVRIFDVDDLSLLGFSFVELTLRVYDETELYSEHPVRVDLSEWGYQSGKPYLSIKTLEIRENQPLGTSLGKLQVLGNSGKPVPGNPSFQLLGIEGDDDLLKRRSLGPALVLNRDGSLHSGRILDFENSASYVVKLRITDEEGLFMETSVDVKVLDEFKPIVRTLKDLPAQDGFQTEIFVEKTSLLDQSTMIEKDTPVAHLKAFLTGGVALSSSHEFEILGNDSSPVFVENPDVKEWITLNPKLDEISSLSNPKDKIFSLILENLDVDARNVPSWLITTKAPSWFVLLRRSYSGKVNEAFTKFDSRNMYGYASQFFPFDGTSLVPGNRFISFPSDLIKKGNGSNWASPQIFPSSDQVTTMNDLEQWLGDDELDLAIYIEDLSVQPKRVYEKRFPFGNREQVINLAGLNEATSAFILKPDGTLITGRDIKVSEKNTWNYEIRINGSEIGYKDMGLEVISGGNTSEPFLFNIENEKKTQSGKLRILGQLYDPDYENSNTDLGFLISSSPNPEISDPEVEVISLSEQGGAFEHYLTLHSNYHKKYYRAYAINGEGVSYGTSYRINVPKSILSMNWTDSTALPSTPGWWDSPWLGEFFRVNDSDWIFHAELGWVYLVTKNKAGGVWLWQETLGWVWTNSNLYPFLYSGSSNRWIFFHGQSRGQLILYDYEASNWVTVEI